MQTNLYRARTFWVGVASVLAAVITAVFGDRETIDHIDIVSTLKTLLGDEKLYLGLAAIFGRASLVNIMAGAVKARAEANT